jgi:chemotaxis protein CheY-P-specific phosphatase CheC
MPEEFEKHTVMAKMMDILSSPVIAACPESEIQEDLEINLTDELLLEKYNAVMNLNGDITGAIILSLNRQTVAELAKDLFGMDLLEMNDEELYMEGAREYLNIIAGGCKNQLMKNGYNFHTSLPEEAEKEMILANYYEVPFWFRSFNYHSGIIKLFITVM